MTGSTNQSSVLPPASNRAAAQQPLSDAQTSAPDRPLRVLHLLGGKEGGGITTAIASLLEGFADQPVDASIVILRNRPAPSDARLEPHAPRYLKKSRGRLPTALSIARLCRRQKIDIIHTHSISSNLYGRLAGLLAPGTRVVTTVHARTRDEMRGNFGNALLESLIVKADLSMHRLSRQLIAVSNWLRDDLIAQGLPAHKVHAIGHGIRVDAPPLSEEHRQQLRSRHDIPQTAPLVGIVGRLTRVKNADLFLRAVAELRRSHPQLIALIVGDGPLREELEQLSLELGIGDHVRFIGWVDDVRPWLQLLDIVVSTSASEGFGYVVLEAMACGTPVVTTDVSEMQHIVAGGTTGLLTEPGNLHALVFAVNRLLCDVTERESMASAARHRAATCFGLDDEAARHLAVYQQVTGHAVPGSKVNLNDS